MIDQPCSIKEHWRRLRIKLSLRIVIDKAGREKWQLSNPRFLRYDPRNVRRHRIPFLSFPSARVANTNTRNESNSRCGTRDAFSIPIYSYIYISLPRAGKFQPRAYLDHVYVYIHTHIGEGCRFYPGKKESDGLYFEFLTRGNTTSRRNSIPGRVVTPVADIFPHDRFACIWLSARFCRENRATNENS